MPADTRAPSHPSAYLWALVPMPLWLMILRNGSERLFPMISPSSDPTLILSNDALRPILNRLRQVRGLDPRTIRQICYGPRQLQDAVKCPRTHLPRRARGIYDICCTSARPMSPLHCNSVPANRRRCRSRARSTRA